MGLLWKFKEACTQHVVSGSKQGHANLIARPHLPPFQVESVRLAESQISDVCTKYTCLFDCAPAGVIALNQKGKSFSFLIPGHLHTLMWWLPTAWGASPSLTNDFPDCSHFCYCRLGIGGGGASSWLVICSAEEVLLLRVVWKFFMLAIYQHQWNKEMTNICPCLTAPPLEILIQQEFVFWKIFAHWFGCRTLGENHWVRNLVEGEWSVFIRCPL